MIGLEYHRKRANLSRTELARKAGLGAGSVKLIEAGKAQWTTYSVYHQLAVALDVTEEELLMPHAPEELELSLRTNRHISKLENRRSCISHYRWQKDLTFSELAQLLGVAGRESARVVCKRQYPRERYIARLAKLEGITPEEFVELYQQGVLL